MINTIITKKEKPKVLSLSKGPNSRILKGAVVSDKMTKTVVVEVVNLKKHSKYKKYFKVSRRYKAHDEKGEYHAGDKVIIQETRPISREKRFRVIEKLT